MKATHIILSLIICAHPLFGSSSAEHKKSKPSQSILSSIKNGLYRTRKTIAAFSECAIGGAVLFYGIRLLPGPTGDVLKKGDKGFIGIYTAGTIIGLSLLLDGIEELNNQVDLTNRSMNMLKKAHTFLTSRKTKTKKTE